MSNKQSFFFVVPEGTNPGGTRTYELPLRPYAKYELAQLYDPGASRPTALRMLHRYITTARGLLPALQQTGYRVSHRRFTRQQVAIIFSYLGEP